MGMALMKVELPGPVKPYDNCVGTSVSNWFDIDPGCEGEIRVHKLPPNVCLTVEEYYYGPCCCWCEYLPVLDECGCQVALDCVGTICLGSGRYHLCMTDKDTGEPYVPDPHDVRISVHHKLCK